MNSLFLETTKDLSTKEDYFDDDSNKLAEDIYRVLTSRKFRAGPQPYEKTKEMVIEKIRSKIEKNNPIEIFQFWGGCKNPNLSIDYADLCEEATFDNLSKLNHEIQKTYEDGLQIWINPGDARVENVNLIPHEKTANYVQSLISLAEEEKYNDLFTIIPVSKLYDEYSIEFKEKLTETKNELSQKIEQHEDFQRLVANARKNIFYKDIKTNEEIQARSINSAKDYVIYRVVEEETQIFREFDECLRTFFIRYTPFYKQYISDISQTIPNLDCSLVFFTGKKGNITQPWQAEGVKQDEKIIFMSQERLKKLRKPAEVEFNCV